MPGRRFKRLGDDPCRRLGGLLHSERSERGDDRDPLCVRLDPAPAVSRDPEPIPPDEPERQPCSEQLDRDAERGGLKAQPIERIRPSTELGPHSVDLEHELAGRDLGGFLILDLCLDRRLDGLD